MTTKETTTAAPAVYGALLNVMKGLESIPKNGLMEFKGTRYNYLRADDVQERINPLLIENNLIVRSEYETVHVTRNISKKESRGDFSSESSVPYVEVHLSLTYISTIDGSLLTVTAVGESQGSDDKSINKALTQAMKNSHRAQFQFASGEKEPDDFVPDSEQVEPRAVTQAKATPKGDVNALRNELVAKLGSLDEAKKKGDEFFKVEAGQPSQWSSNPGDLQKLLDHLKTGEV